MAKGLFTQTLCLLTQAPPSLDMLRTRLGDRGFEIAGERPASGSWQLGGPSLMLPYRPDVNGYVIVDVVEHPWPDGMGDPGKDPGTFGAWSMGHFGPLAFPGGLERAVQHAWSWEHAKLVVPQHTGFLRLRLSYCLGADEAAPVQPPDVDPAHELSFLARTAIALGSLPGVLCIFNPNGEILRDAASFARDWSECGKARKLPLLLWMNIRFCHLDATYSLMDTVGNAQLDVPDVEAIFPRSETAPADVDHYLRNVTHYLLDLDRPLRTGEDIDGPGESDLSWTIEALEDGSLQPPRRTYRLTPKAHGKAIRKLLP
jgi:hypothetical protein